MRFLQLRGFDVDANGMKMSVPEEEREPVCFYLDELDKYDSGYIHWHWHAGLELILANTPMDVFVQDTLVPLKTGEGMFINAGVMHLSRPPENSRSASAYTVVFPAEYIAERGSAVYEKCVRPVTENPSLPFVALRQNGWQARMLSELEHAVQIYEKNDAGSELAVRNVLCELWLILLRNVDQVQQPAVSHRIRRREQRLKTMLAFVQENYMEKITLEQIADAASVSKSECLNCFREGFGISPMAYLVSYRLEIACHLLRRSGRSIGEISLCCGFDDPAYFSRVFKENYGITPRQYRDKE